VQKMLHTLSHIRLTLTRLPSKGNRLLLGRSRWLLNVEQQWNPSDRYSRFQVNWHFAFEPMVRLPLFSWRYHL
jgi:hypothetical protein